MYWNVNRQALLKGSAASHQALISALEQTVATADAELSTTAAGDYTLLYKNIYLHHTQGALKEANAVTLSSCKPALGRAHLLIGLGLGYGLEATYQCSPGQVVVYEPDLPLLKFVLENVDLSEYLSSGRVWIANTEAQVLARLRPLTANADPLDIIVLPGYAQLLSATIPSLMAQLFRMVEERVRDLVTGQYFHEQWTRQFFLNTPHFSQTLAFDSVGKQFSGKPALIIGRGPSLDNALDDISALSGCLTLIAVGSAMHRLYQAGITPDIAIFYDANGMREQLHGLPDSFLREITFFISPFTESICFEAPSKAKALFFPQNGEPFAEWLAASQPEASPLHQPLILEGGGTVSLVAMQLALALHSSAIILIGQDLAFPNNQVYAGGMLLKQDTQGRMALDKSESLYTAPEAMTTVRGQNQQKLPALKAYAGFIHHFERLAEMNANRAEPIPLYNASLGGADIQGYALITLAEFGRSLTPCKGKQLPANGLRENNSPWINPTPPAHKPSNAMENLRVALSCLRQAISEGIQLHQATLPDSALHLPEANMALFNFLNHNPLISHFLMFELMKTHQQYNPNPTNDEAIAHNKALLHQSTRHCIELLQDTLLPQVLNAERLVLTGASTAYQVASQCKASPSADPHTNQPIDHR